MNNAKYVGMDRATGRGLASADEQAKLLAWKRYRVLINRINVEAASDIDWPLSPDA